MCWLKEHIYIYRRISITLGKFEGNKGVITSCKMDRQYNGQKKKVKKDKQFVNDPQNTAQKTKDWATQTP